VGVLQGIGPVGQRGLKGEQGRQGDQGVQGETGPTGGIENYACQFTLTSATSCAANVSTLIGFATTVYDECNAHQSSTAFSPLMPGDYQISCWVNFAKPSGTAINARTLSFVINSTTIAKHSCNAVGATGTTVNMVFPWRFQSGDVLHVYGLSADTATISVDSGALGLNRMGAGRRGDQGIQGLDGPVGAAGPQGPVGPTGSASGGFVSYADLLP